MKRIIIVCFFLLTSAASAQLTSSIQLGYTHDSNVFGNYAEVPDNYLSLNLNLDNYVGWDYSALDLSYSGGLSSYASYPEQDNWNHSLNVNYAIQLSRAADDPDNTGQAPVEDGGFSLPADSTETSLAFSGALNRTVPHSGGFAVYASYNTEATAGLRLALGQNSILRLRYGLNYTGYDQVTSLSNLENVGIGVVSFMPTRSVYFYLNGSIGSKKYYAVDTVSAAVKSLINMHAQGRYKGKGKSGSQTGSSAKTYVLDSPSASQATYGAGLNFDFGRWRAYGSLLLRRDLTGAARYIDAVAKLSAAQSEIYDDPYSYQGSEFGIGVRKDSLIAGISFSVKLNGANKDYSRPAFDTSQTVIVANQRKDKFSDFAIGLSRDFPSGGFPAGYSVALNYDHINNSSNDEFYRFTDDIVTLSLSVNLF